MKYSWNKKLIFMILNRFPGFEKNSTFWGVWGWVVGWNGGGGLALAERSAKSTIFFTSPLTKFNLIYL